APSSMSPILLLHAAGRLSRSSLHLPADKARRFRAVDCRSRPSCSGLSRNLPMEHILETDPTMSPRPCLSVIVPCYNERATIAEVLRQVLASPWTGEVVVVDDGSSDGSADVVQSVTDPRVRLLRQTVNQGKGAALRRGLAVATMPYVVVQDADLEYDP